MSSTPPLVWLYKKGPKHGDYHRKAIEEAHYSQELLTAIESGTVDPDVPVDLNEFGPTSILLQALFASSHTDRGFWTNRIANIVEWAI